MKQRRSVAAGGCPVPWVLLELQTLHSVTNLGIYFPNLVTVISPH
jgi:hypothetical protein